jgi:Zn-dependent protease
VHIFLEKLSTNPLYFFCVVITVIISVCLHELAHGWVAIRLGDRTPIERGHMTLDPWVHMGMWSILALMVMGLSWGSMPVNPSRLRGRHADAIVSAAGPMMNLLLAAIALTALGVWDGLTPRAAEDHTAIYNAHYFMWIFGVTNLELLVFNLLPVPPLDGSHIAASFSRTMRNVFDRSSRGGAGSLLLLGVFFFGGALLDPLADWGALYVHWITQLVHR